MNVYADIELVNRHLDVHFVNKLINCNFNFFHPEIHEIKENSLFVTIGGFLFDPPEELKIKIKQIKNKSLLIMHTGKSLSNSTESISSFKKFAEEYEFKNEKIYIITQLNYDATFINHQIPNCNILGYDRWLHEFFEFSFFQVVFRDHSCYKITNDLPQQKFSIFCKRYESSRLEIFCHLIANNLLDNFHYTFVGDLFMFSDSTYDMAKDIPIEFNTHIEKITNWLKGVPYQPAKQLPDTVFQHYHYPPELKNYFQSSLIHISLETEPTNSSFITEKTYRAMFYKKPFILISQFNALKALKKEGYKTFSPYINESYDDIEDYQLRLNAIIQEIKRLNELPSNELNFIIQQCQETIEHNYKILHENVFNAIPDNFKFKDMLNFDN